MVLLAARERALKETPDAIAGGRNIKPQRHSVLPRSLRFGCGGATN